MCAAAKALIEKQREAFQKEKEAERERDGGRERGSGSREQGASRMARQAPTPQAQPGGGGCGVLGHRGRVRLFARQLHPLAQQAQRLQQPGHRVHARRLVGERHGEEGGGGGSADANVAAGILAPAPSPAQNQFEKAQISALNQWKN